MPIRPLLLPPPLSQDPEIRQARHRLVEASELWCAPRPEPIGVLPNARAAAILALLPPDPTAPAADQPLAEDGAWERLRAALARLRRAAPWQVDRLFPNARGLLTTGTQRDRAAFSAACAWRKLQLRSRRR